MIYIALLIAKLTSPSLAIVAGLAGFLSRAWWHILIGAMAAAGVQEMILHSVQYARRFDPLTFAISIAAGLVWAGAVYAIKRAVTSRKPA